MTSGRDWVSHEWRVAIGQRPNPRELGELLSRLVAPRVSHDALRLIASHPALRLETGAFSIWHEYDAGLGRALLLNGQQEKRPSREVLAAHGASGELCLPLRDSRGDWGMLALLRTQGGARFAERDLEKLTEMTPTLIAAVQVLATTRPPSPTAPAPPAGVIILDRQHRIKAVTPQVHDWGRLQVAPDSCGSLEWANIAMSLAVRRRARDPKAPLPLAYAPPICFGRWVTVQGQPLDDDGTGDVAVVMQAAGVTALEPFCEWYGITARERAVVRELCTGSAPKQIARLLDLSPHTVNDHLKSVYLKTGVGGRGELMAMLTA